MTERTRVLPVDGPLDLHGTLTPSGKGRDPARRLGDGAIWRAYNAPTGPATLRIAQGDGAVHATAWGPGAEHALETLPDLLGLHDDPEVFVPDHPVLRQVSRRHRGVRFGRTDCAVEAIIRAIPAQRVTAKDAQHTARDLKRRYGDPAPGPADLRLPPHPDRIAALSYAELHACGLERGRAMTLIEVCRRAKRIEALRDRPTDDAMTALMSIRGIGPWTAARVAEVAWGATDAVEVGDYWLPSFVAFALAGEVRAGDQRMLELLEPFRPHRGRAVRLLMLSGIDLPRFGPRTATRDFRGQ